MRKWAPPVLLILILGLAVVLSPQAQGIVLSGFFTDDNGNLFEADIDAIAQAGITKGCNPPANTRYCPTLAVERGAMAAFIRRALSLPASNTDFFTDDNNSIFEADINAMAAAGITKGCNPPANTRFCPTARVDRGAMAAFLKRALDLPLVGTDFFNDDNNSIFEADINAIAAAGITKGCNPPANTQYCPRNVVDRGAMAAFLRRALDLPFVTLQIPMGSHNALNCSKDGERCSLTVDVSAGRTYRIQEGLFQVTPATSSEQSQFNSSGTNFTLTLDGNAVSISEGSQQSSGGVTSRNWARTIAFSQGNHSLVGRWQWNGALIQTNTITIRASS